MEESRAAQVARQSQKLQKTLFDSVSHELKTPLAAMSADLATTATRPRGIATSRAPAHAHGRSLARCDAFGIRTFATGARMVRPRRTFARSGHTRGIEGWKCETQHRAKPSDRFGGCSSHRAGARGVAFQCGCSWKPINRSKRTSCVTMHILFFPWPITGPVLRRARKIKCLKNFIAARHSAGGSRPGAFDCASVG